MTGWGCGIVVGTGIRTEVGKIAGAVSETAAAKPPLLIRMEDFSRKVGILIVAASMVVAFRLPQRAGWIGSLSIPVKRTG